MSGRTEPKAPRHKRAGAGKTRALAMHLDQPAGTKLARRFMKAKTGTKAKTGAEARAWYRAYRP